jgi:predicted dehydrogenase
MNTVYTWGFLGFGQVARQRMLPALLNHSQSQLAAIASKSAQIEDIPAGVTLYDDYEKLLQDERVSIIYIALANNMHTEWVRKALLAGKHVLCEKPLTMCENEATELIKLAQKHSLLLLEGYMYRYSKRMELLESYLNSGVIGDLVYVQSNFFSLRSRLTGIRSNKALGGGAMWDLGVYPLNLINYLLNADGTNEIVRIAATGKIEGEVESYVSGQISYKNGTIGSFGFGWISEVRDITTILIGTKGRIVIEGVFNWAPGRIQVLTDQETISLDIAEEDPFIPELDTFVGLLEGGVKTPKMTQDESVRLIALVESVFQEMQTI